MKKYNAYKDSEVKWIGEIPEHWEITPLKFCFKVLSGATPKSTELSYWEDGNINWITPADFKTEDRFISDGVKKITKEGFMSCSTTLIPSGSIIFSKRAPIGSVVINSNEVCTNQGCLSCIPKDDISSLFFYYIMSVSQKYFDMLGTGTTFNEISANVFKNVHLPVPPLSEQQAIASYLDAKTEKMDQMIAKAEKKIEYLGELKQSLITRAVTRGLNPNAPLKDSGVKWIGDIPRDWEIPRLNFVTSKIGSGSTPKGGSEVYVDEGVVFLRSQNVYNDGLRLNDVVHIVPSIHEQMKGTKVQVDDILFNITGASIGRCCRFTKGIGEANVNQHVCIVRPKNILPTFLMYCLQSFVGQTQLRQLLKGGNREGLSGESFKNFYVLLPSPNEQQQIATYLDIKCSKIDHIVATQKKKIAYLQELKQSLITLNSAT